MNLDERGMGLANIGAGAMGAGMGAGAGVGQAIGNLSNPMPRGTGFGEQGGYQGQVYNTPQQNINPQDFIQRMPMPMGQITDQDAQMMAQPQPMPRMQQLSPDQIGEFRKLLHQKRLEQMFKQQSLGGMLGGQ